MKVKLDLENRREILKRIADGESVYSLAKEYKVSRVLIYRLRKKARISLDRIVPGSRKPRKKKLPIEVESTIINLVITYPELSSHKIAQLIKGKLPLGAHGVYNLMKRYNLNRYDQRVKASGKRF